MKLYKEVKEEDKDWDKAKFMVTVAIPIEITEQEIREAENTLMEGECQAKINGFKEGIEWALSKLKGDD